MRALMKNTSLVVAAAGVVSVLWPAHPAVAAPSPIRHVVVIYQENHSFDNTLGDLCVTDARCDGSIARVTFRDGTTVTPAVAPDIVSMVNHTVASQKLGLANRWDHIAGCTRAAGYACADYYTPHQIPELAHLARRFALSDRTFQSTDAPSWGAHMNVVSGTLDGFTGDNPLGVARTLGWGCDSRKESTWIPPGATTATTIMEPTCVPDPALRMPYGGAFRPSPVAYVPTIMDRLNAAGLTWRLYSQPKASTDGGYQWAMCPTFAECLYTGQAANMVPNTQVLADATTGNLPAFSVVSPSTTNSQHNGDSMATGDAWIGQIVNAIENGPDWSSTAIFIAYDDCGCFYDHVHAPQGDGVRSPLVIVSPYARSGYTDHRTTTVTGGILAFTEHTFGLAPLTPLDATAYDWRASFNYRQIPIAAKALPSPAPASNPVASAANEQDPT